MKDSLVLLGFFVFPLLVILYPICLLINAWFIQKQAFGVGRIGTAVVLAIPPLTYFSAIYFIYKAVSEKNKRAAP